MPKALVNSLLDTRPQMARSRRPDPKVLWRSRVHPAVGSVKTWLVKLTPARRFQVASLVVLLLGMLATGWWMNHQIEAAEEQESLRVNALYISNVVSPLLQPIGGSATLSSRNVAILNTDVSTMLHRDNILGLVVVAKDGRIIYSSRPEQIGQRVAVEGELADALTGQTTWEVPNAAELKAEGWPARPENARELYCPVRDVRTGIILAVAEVYKDAALLLQDIASAQQQTWAVVGGASLLIYVLLFGFIEQISNVVVQQQGKLRRQVTQLSDLLAQNEELRSRARQATHRVAALHERALRAVGADLHDGPAQYLGNALLRLDVIAAYHEKSPADDMAEHLDAMKYSLTQAMEEVRALASGLAVPYLETMSLREVVMAAVTEHERSSNTLVRVEFGEMPAITNLSIRLTLYRILQEGLSNAYRHGGGIDERVTVALNGDQLSVEITDAGPGLDPDTSLAPGKRMGLRGMRDRVESLGGEFEIMSRNGRGTQIHITLPLLDIDDNRG